MIQYAYTIMYVSDIEETVTFYEEAFGFTRKFITPEKDYGEIATGNTTIAFAIHSLAIANLPRGYETSNIKEKPFGIELGFTTANPAKTIDNAIDAGAVLEEPIVRKPWGQEVGYLRDINGFLIEICTPMKN